MQRNSIEFTVEQAIRADLTISQKTGLSRSAAKKIIEGGGFLINGEPFFGSKKLKVGDKAVIILPHEEKQILQPSEVKLSVIYEDDDLAVIDKPRGMTVHSGSGTGQTLVNALLSNFKSLSALAGEFRPGIVHRLDKDTSGLMIIAKNDKAHAALSKQLKDRQIRRFYLAVLDGVLKNDSGEISAKIGRHAKWRTKMTVTQSGKDAKTLYKVLSRYKDNTLCEFEIITGRTHQIRVHAKYIGHPVTGDKVYGKSRKDIARQLLHSHKLCFIHPFTGQELCFEAPLPDDFTNFITALF